MIINPLLTVQLFCNRDKMKWLFNISVSSQTNTIMKNKTKINIIYIYISHRKQLFHLLIHSSLYLSYLILDKLNDYFLSVCVFFIFSPSLKETMKMIQSYIQLHPMVRTVNPPLTTQLLYSISFHVCCVQNATGVVFCGHHKQILT